MDWKYIIVGISIVFICIVTVSMVSADCNCPLPPRKFDKKDFVSVQVSSSSGERKVFSFNIDYLWFQGDSNDDPIFIVHAGVQLVTDILLQRLNTLNVYAAVLC